MPDQPTTNTTSEDAAARIAEILLPRIAQMIREQTDEFRRHHHGLAARVTEIEAHAVLTETIAFSACRTALETIAAPPQDIIDACQQPPGHQQTATVDVYGRRVRRSITGGSDPTHVWRDMCLSVLREARPQAGLSGYGD